MSSPPDDLNACFNFLVQTCRKSLYGNLSALVFGVSLIAAAIYGYSYFSGHPQPIGWYVIMTTTLIMGFFVVCSAGVTLCFRPKRPEASAQDGQIESSQEIFMIEGGVSESQSIIRIDSSRENKTSTPLLQRSRMAAYDAHNFSLSPSQMYLFGLDSDSYSQCSDFPLGLNACYRRSASQECIKSETTDKDLNSISPISSLSSSSENINGKYRLTLNNFLQYHQPCPDLNDQTEFMSARSDYRPFLPLDNSLQYHQPCLNLNDQTEFMSARSEYRPLPLDSSLQYHQPCSDLNDQTEVMSARSGYRPLSLDKSLQYHQPCSDLNDQTEFMSAGSGYRHLPEVFLAREHEDSDDSYHTINNSNESNFDDGKNISNSGYGIDVNEHKDTEDTDDNRSDSMSRQLSERSSSLENSDSFNSSNSFYTDATESNDNGIGITYNSDDSNTDNYTSEQCLFSATPEQYRVHYSCDNSCDFILNPEITSALLILKESCETLKKYKIGTNSLYQSKVSTNFEECSDHEKPFDFLSFSSFEPQMFEESINYKNDSDLSLLLKESYDLF